MPFNFCPKRDASFWKNGSELKRFVLELQTGGFADYSYNFCLWVIGINDVQGVWKSFTFANKRKNKVCKRTL